MGLVVEVEEEEEERRGRVKGVSCGGEAWEGRRDWREIGGLEGSSMSAGIVMAYTCVLLDCDFNWQTGACPASGLS